MGRLQSLQQLVKIVLSYSPRMMNQWIVLALMVATGCMALPPQEQKIQTMDLKPWEQDQETLDYNGMEIKLNGEEEPELAENEENELKELTEIKQELAENEDNTLEELRRHHHSTIHHHKPYVHMI